MKGRATILTQRPETVSVVDEKVDGAVDGQEKVVEADDDFECLRIKSQLLELLLSKKT